jgi:hypothetical protein
VVAHYQVDWDLRLVNLAVRTMQRQRTWKVEPPHDSISPNDMASRPPPTRTVVNVEGIVASTIVVPVFTLDVENPTQVTV